MQSEAGGADVSIARKKVRMVSGATNRSSQQSAKERNDSTESRDEDDKHKLKKMTSGLQKMVGRDSLAS